MKTTVRAQPRTQRVDKLIERIMMTNSIRFTSLATLATLLGALAGCGSPAAGACDDCESPDSGPVSTDAAEPRTLTVGMAGEGDVEVYIDGAACQSLPCTYEAELGAEVTLEVRPELSTRFEGWIGGGCANEQVCVVSIASDQNLDFEVSLRGQLLSQDTIAGIVSPAETVWDAEGNRYIFGTYIVGVPFTNFTQPSKRRGYVAKLREDGSRKWAKGVDFSELTSLFPQKNGLVVSAANEVYVVVRGRVSPTGPSAIKLRRLDSETGQTVWTREIVGGDSSVLLLNETAVGTSGNLFVATVCMETITLGTRVLSSPDQEALCLATFDKDGALLNFEKHGVPNDDASLVGTMVPRANGGFVAQMHIGDLPMIYEFNSSGFRLARHVLPDLDRNMTGGTLGEASDGNLLLVGNFFGEITFGDTVIPAPEFERSGRFLAKFSPTATPISLRRLPGSMTSTRDVEFTDDGFFVASRLFNSHDILDVGNGPLDEGNNAVQAYTEEGELRWAKVFTISGGQLQDVGSAPRIVEATATIIRNTTTELGILLPEEHADNTPVLHGGTPARFTLSD